MGENKNEELKDLKRRLISWALKEIDEGTCNDPQAIHSYGEIIDMIKDVAAAEASCQEAEKNMKEAEYYEAVKEAMEEYGENPRMGYPRRNSRGQYSSRGRSGYPDQYYMQEAEGGRSGGSGSSGNSGNSGGNRGGSGGGRSGYTPEMYNPNDNMMLMSHMQHQEDREDWEDPRYSRPFNKYRRAKRHFTETHSAKDQQEMKDSANEHVMESIATLREIWDSADPDMRKRMKTDMTKLVGDMQP